MNGCVQSGIWLGTKEFLLRDPLNPWSVACLCRIERRIELRVESSQVESCTRPETSRKSTLKVLE